MTVVREREQRDLLNSPEFPSQVDLVSECVDALVAAGQPDAVPYLALALLSTFTLKSNKGGWEKLG